VAEGEASLAEVQAAPSAVPLAEAVSAAAAEVESLIRPDGQQKKDRC
jgi:hypothetical protein